MKAALTKEEFEQGRFCTLIFTELQEYDGKYLSAFSPDGQGISEDTVQVGDELPVYTLNEDGKQKRKSDSGNSDFTWHEGRRCAESTDRWIWYIDDCWKEFLEEIWEKQNYGI